MDDEIAGGAMIFLAIGEEEATVWRGGDGWWRGEKSKGTNGLGEAFEEIDIGVDGLIGIVIELRDGVGRAGHGGPAWERES